MIRVCRNCETEFAEKIVKKGFVDQCDDCSEDPEARHIGYNDGTLNKSTHISVYRGKDPNVIKKLLRKQGNPVT